MKSTNVFLSTILTFAIMLSSVSFSFARFDEGMFTAGPDIGVESQEERAEDKPEEIYILLAAV